MTLDQIDLVGNGFHETPNAFIKSHTMEKRGEAKVWTMHTNILQTNTLL